MSGIEKHRVVNKPQDELDDLCCSICQEIFDEPVVTKDCGHTYCKDCINEWLLLSNTCPLDRKPLSSDQLITGQPELVNTLKELTVKCVNYGNGCDSVLTIEEMAKHSEECKYFMCISCKSSKSLLKEKEKEINLLRKLLKANENDMQYMNERLRSATISPNRSEVKISY